MLQQLIISRYACLICRRNIMSELSVYSFSSIFLKSRQYYIVFVH